MKRHRRATHTSIIMITLAATLAASTGGCSSDSDSGLPPPASPGPQTTDGRPALDLTPAEQQAVDEAQARFDAFMNDYISVSTADLPTAETAEDLFSQVERHGDGLVPQELRREIVGRWGEGEVMQGMLQWDLLEVVSVDMDSQVDGVTMPRVDLLYCVDATNWAGSDIGESEPTQQEDDRSAWLYGLAWHDNWGGLGLEGWRVVERLEERATC